MSDAPHEAAAHAAHKGGDKAHKMGKGLAAKFKGHNKYVYIAGAVVLIGVAWMMYRRSTSAATDAGTAPADAATDPAFADTGSASGDGGGGGNYASDGFQSGGDYGGAPTGYYDTTDPGTVDDPVGSDSPDAHVTVEFGALPTTKQKPAHNGHKKKQKANPTGGGTHPKRNPDNKFHPNDPRHPHQKAKKAGAAAGKVAAQAGRGRGPAKQTTAHVKARAAAHTPQKPSTRHAPKKHAGKK
jgi:hypothetical protein